MENTTSLPTTKSLSSETETETDVALRAMTGRWRFLILSALSSHPRLRFSEIQRTLTGIGRPVLAKQLRALEREGVIHRHVFASLSPHVEYSLSPLGESLKPVMQAIRDWSHRI